MKACRVMQIDRTTPYVWRKNEPDFAAEWDSIQEELLDDLEDSALKRATKGHTQPIYNKLDQKIGSKRIYETALTIFMLKARRRERYLIDQASAPVAESLSERLAREDEEQRRAGGTASLPS